MVATPESVGMSWARLARIHPVMQSYVDRGLFAGLSVAVARRGQTVLSAQYGFQDREAEIPMTPESIFRMYSMTKPVVSTALMLLVEEGAVRLLDPVAKYIPAFAAVKVEMADGALVDPVRPVLVRDLLTHTSGLTYDFLEDFPVAAQYRERRIMNDPTRTLAEVVDEIAALPLAFQPGTRWHYSVGIEVAARIVELASGQPLGLFLADRMFGPLGMADTGFGVPADQLHRLCAMYGFDDLFGPGATLLGLYAGGFDVVGERRDVDASYPTDQPDVFGRGGIGLFSTLGDSLRFAQMLANGGELDGERLLSRTTLSLMHSNHLPPALLPYELVGLPNPGWGFGLGSRVLMDVAAMGTHGSVGEFGWAGAAKTYFWVDPREELVGVLLSQSMIAIETPDQDLRTLAYQAIID